MRHPPSLREIADTKRQVPAPALEISSIAHTLETQRIVRQEHFRTISVAAFPLPGRLNSEALNPVLPALEQFQKSLPAGFKMQIGGEKAKQTQGFANLVVVMLVMIFGIYMALLVQYAQVGGLAVAAFITLLLVPVLYSIFVLDLKIVKWGALTHADK